jgi:hypothetical protein
MPRGDHTGPWGLGPRTGRAFGRCAGYPTPGYMTAGPGLGRGWGFGRGPGRGPGLGMGFGRGGGYRRAWAGPYPAYGYPPGIPFVYPPAGARSDITEESYLSDQAEYLEEELKSIRERLDELRSAGKEAEDKK